MQVYSGSVHKYTANTCPLCAGTMLDASQRLMLSPQQFSEEGSITILHFWCTKKKRQLLSVQFSSVQFSRSVMSDSLRPHESCRTPGLPVHHQLPEFTQTHVHRVRDAIQPSHPLSYPSPPAPNPSQHQGLFQWLNSSHEVAKVLEFQLQHQSLQWTPRTDLL